MTELDNGGSNQGSADRDAKNQILDYGETIHRFVSFKITTKEFETQASFGLKQKDEFNIKTMPPASHGSALRVYYYYYYCSWIQESKS